MAQVESIRGTPHLASLFDRHGTLVRVEPGASLTSQGQPLRSVYRVRRGCLRACVYSEDGHRNILQFHNEGDFLGLTGAPEWAVSTEAVGEAQLLSIGREVLQAALERTPELHAEMLDVLRHQIEAHADLLVLTANGSAVDRVREFLRGFSRAHPEPSGVTCLPMPRQDIADHLALSVETVCRSITALKTDGEIDLLTATRFRFLTRQDAEGRFASAA